MILRTVCPVRFSTVTYVMSILAAQAALAKSPEPRDSIEEFLRDGRAVVAELEKPTPNLDGIVVTISAMLESAKPVVVAYGEKHSQCAEQLAKMLELYPQIDTWTAQEIRRGIEAANALPAAEGCYPARDIVAHPAIVRALIRAGLQPEQTPRLIREMNEALEHMQEISNELGSK